MSEKSGYLLRLETPEDLRQLRLALGLPEPREWQTFRGLAAEWYAETSGRLVDPGNERRHIARLNEAVGNLTEETLLPSAIVKALAAMADLAPATKNKIRSTGARIVDAARLDGRWRAGNPFTAFKAFREPKRAYDTLSADEAERVLRCIRKDLLHLFRVALIMGPRKGELFGLRKEDIDLRARTMWIRRSYGRNTTKTGRPRLVPIPAAVVEDLRQAVEESPTEYVFPAADGGLRRKDAQLSRLLRTAMGAAGAVLGYDAKCRRCQHTEKLELKESRRCPMCGFALWLVPRVRRIRFYDLRHTAATLHREAGCDPLVIKLLLGHAARDATDDIYSHLSLEFQRAQLNKLSL